MIEKREAKARLDYGPRIVSNDNVYIPNLLIPRTPNLGSRSIMKPVSEPI